MMQSDVLGMSLRRKYLQQLCLCARQLAWPATATSAAAPRPLLLPSLVKPRHLFQQQRLISTCAAASKAAEPSAAPAAAEVAAPGYDAAQIQVRRPRPAAWPCSWVPFACARVGWGRLGTWIAARSKGHARGVACTFDGCLRRFVSPTPSPKLRGVRVPCLLSSYLAPCCLCPPHCLRVTLNAHVASSSYLCPYIGP